MVKTGDNEINASASPEMKSYPKKRHLHKGSRASRKQQTQPPTMTAHACLRRIFRSGRMAKVMACQRSRVMTVSVYTDSSLAKTVKKPAVLHPGPVCQSMA
ncbi:hypothetical protein MC885_003544 [Smutsia gigantea]|nr:hypothetical protein MC885_003544 [Smutsia gigantea]